MSILEVRRSSSFDLASRVWALLGVGVVLIAASIRGAVPAAALSAPPYGHSWYVTTHSTTTMYNRGYADGQFDTQNCTGSMVFLDFGQPTQWYYSGSNYQQYGTYDFREVTYMSDDQILSLAENYAAGWWDGSSSCPYLHLAFGTNNYNECPAPGTYSLTTCSVSTAGAEWGILVNNFNSWLQVRHRDTSTGTYWWYGQQEAVVAGDDIESGWDCPSQTRSFVAAYNSNTSVLTYDYGDFYASGCWTSADFFYVGWGAADDYTLPETYTNYQINALVSDEQAQGNMFPAGNMTTCSGGDPVPSQTCSNGWYGPVGGWNALYNAQAGASLAQGSMAWSTNIQTQP